ncbi:MAG: FGGY family carbohydrate kinase [Ruminococcus sp.]
MNQSYLIGIDIGTSACKVALLTGAAGAGMQPNGDYPVYYPKEGWAEQNPEEWWSAVCGAVRQVIEEASVAPEEIAGVGIDGQSWSAIAIDRNGHVSDQIHRSGWTHRAQSICDRSQRGNRCREHF